WQLLRRQLRPTRRRLAALGAAATGLALLVLGQPGGLHALRLNPLGAIFALVSTVAFSHYMLGSAPLVRAIGPQSATSWGLTLGSIPMLAWAPPWQVHLAGSVLTGAALTGVVVVACTAITFRLSLGVLRNISPTESAVTSTLEPAMAGLAGAWFLL